MDVGQLVYYHSDIWLDPQQNNSTPKILSVMLCISKLQKNPFNKIFLLRIDCKSAKGVLQKDVKNLVSKQIFVRWQTILSSFDFDIEYIKGEKNSLTDFLTRDFLQGKSNKTHCLQETK